MISGSLLTYQRNIRKSQRLIKMLRLVGPWLATWQDWSKIEKLNRVIREWCHYEDAAIITHQSICKSQRLIKVLRLVGPWLTTWQDWSKIEKLNKVIREWCHSEDAAIGLFGLWQECTMSLYEMATQNNFMEFLARDTYFENPIPFVGYSGGIGNAIHVKALHRSLWQLSDLEKRIVENASCTGSCVRHDPLPIKGGETDQWLLIDCSDLEKTQENCIPPYYHLNFAVPKGLKIVLSDPDAYCFNDPSTRREEIYRTVGRAGALGLSRLIVYYDDPFVMVNVLESFVSTLHKQKAGFVSLLEMLSFPYPERYWFREKEHNKMFRGFLTSLRNQFALGKLRNLKYLNIGFVNRNENAGLDLRKVLYTCPNLQVLELGSCSNHEYYYLQNIKLLDTIHGRHNSINFDSIDPFTAGKEQKASCLSEFDIGNNSLKRKRAIEGIQRGLFSSLKVILCQNELEDEKLTGALASGCRDLRLLQIYYSDFCCCNANWDELLKRLFVLILKVHCKRNRPRPLQNCCFPEGCELRVLTVYGDCCSNYLLWLEELMNIVDVCLPKLLLLNVLFYEYDTDSLSEIAKPRGNLEYHFRQKSIDLRFAYQSEKGLVTFL